MGCSSSNMVAVEPAKPTEKVIDINNNKPASPKKERQIGSATSKRSVRSTADSGLGDGESTCITDSFITSRTFSGRRFILTYTLRDIHILQLYSDCSL